MILTYFDINTRKTFTYVSSFDKSKILGEKNKFNQVLVSLQVYDYLDKKIISYSSGNKCLLDTWIRYWKKKGDCKYG